MIETKEMYNSVVENFERYAGNVILDRAICDVRDMLKPSARMLLYSQMAISKNYPSKPYIKSARVVGDVLGHFYEHGEGSCYGTYMHMAKPFTMRVPLESCYGNCGTMITNGDEASMRYTELRLSEISKYIYGGLDKKAIGEQWRLNFSADEKYPAVMPSIGYFNICNGTIGLGIGISSSIPQFNIKDVNNAICALIKDPNTPDASVIIMPDFATGGILVNRDEVYKALKNGNGASCRLRGKITYDEKTNALLITELPYTVYSEVVTQKIRNIIEKDEDCGIKNVNDNTGLTPEITVYLEKKANPSSIIKRLYKEAMIESCFTINMWVLEQGRFPKLMGLREIFINYINHIRECQKNILQYDYDKALARLNVVEGLLIAAANIDEVVQIIRGSSNPSEAAEKLITRFGFNKEQVDAILAMKLSSLTKVDAIKLNNEKEELLSTVANLAKTLSTPSMIDDILIKSLQEVAMKFGDERRTKIENIIESAEKEEEKEIALNLYADSTIDTSMGEIKSKQIPIYSYHTTTSEKGLLFMNSGVMYPFTLKSNMKGTNVYDLIKSFSSEKIIFFIDTATLKLYENIIVITKKGYVKKMPVAELKGNKASYEKMDSDDEVVKVLLSNSEDDKIFVVSSKARYTYYGVASISLSSRNARGQIGIKLDSNDYVADAGINEATSYDSYIVTLSKGGKVKRTPATEYPTTGTNAKGYEAAKLMDNDVIDRVYFVTEDLQSINFMLKNKLKTAPICSIPISGRATIGIKIITI